MSRVNQTMDEDDDDDLAQTDEGASSWLQSIGLNSKEYRSLDPEKVKLYPYTSKSNDSHTQISVNNKIAV